MRRKLLAIVLVVVMVVTLLPMSTSAITESEVTAKLNGLIQGTAMSGKYVPGKDNPVSGECFGFAVAVFNYVFGTNLVKDGGYANARFNSATQPSGAMDKVRDVSHLGDDGTFSEPEVVALLRQARRGDLLLLANPGQSWGHAMIIWSVASDGTPTVYDANAKSEGIDKVGLHEYTLGAATTHNGAATLYRYKDYDDGNNPPATSSDFTIENGVLTDYQGSGGDVAIPDGVTSIGKLAFSNRTDLTSVTIPSNVTNIGEMAFRDCTRLASVTIPNSVNSIGANAFAGCTNLTSVNIPNGVISIGGQAFYRCEGLTSVTIPDSVISMGENVFLSCDSLIEFRVGTSNLNYTAVNGVLFTRNTETLLAYPGGRQGSYTIPKGTISIGDNAFECCTGLTGVNIPSSVTNIGEDAFMGCDNLNSVTIPGSVTGIGKSTFFGCNGLTSVIISEGVTNIGNHAFRYCASLTDVKIPTSVTSMGSFAFADCTGLTSVIIPVGVTSIGNRAFYNCDRLTAYIVAGSYAEVYCTTNNISFIASIASGTAREGTMENTKGKNVAWSVTAKGEVQVDKTDLVQGEKVLVGCFDAQGRFTGVKVLDAQHTTDTIDPSTPNVKLFWLDGAQKPQSPSATVWGK